tara:strand:- start:106 stop:447 length:342 start_codon:yes stop_codon:yes gene_type:complete
MTLIDEEDMYWISYAWHQGHRLDAYGDSNRPHCENEDGTWTADRMGRLEEALEGTDWFSKMQDKYGDEFLDWHYDISAELLDDMGHRKENITGKMIQNEMEDGFGYGLGEEEE